MVHRNLFFRNFFILLLAGTGLFSCSKSVDHCTIPDQFLGYCRFREGSYWIYRNERTGVSDCTFITKYNSATFFEDGDNYTILYYFDMEWMEASGPFLRKIDARCSTDDFAEVTYSLNYLSQEIWFTTSLASNPQYREAWYEGQASVGVVAVYPTETVNGKIFTNVYHCRVADQRWDGDSVITDAHLVKNVGFVKFTKRIDQADTTWTLVRWNVIQ